MTIDSPRLRPKYMVTRTDDNGHIIGPTMKSANPDDVDSPFVLMPRKDPAAFMAMLAYASCCEPSLGNQIRIWLVEIARAPPVYGTQGERNRIAMRMRNIQESG